MSLRKKATSGLVWTFMDMGFSKAVGLVASIALGRLLSPTDFGLLAMIYIFTAISTAIVDGGLTESLVRSNDADQSDFSTIFYTNMLLAIGMYIVLFFAAPYISLFYGEPILTAVLRVYALVFIINAISAVHSCLFTREMNFRIHMIVSVPGIVIGTAAGILMAYNDYGVWSIVWMHLTTQGVYSIMYLIVSSWKPSFIFSKVSLKRHLDFGYKLTLTSIINTGFRNIYNVIIGKFYSTQALGQFDRARVFNDYPVQMLTVMITKVTYPLLSQIQDEKERLKMAYQQILQLVFFIAAPLMLVLSVVSEPLITLLIGEKWLQAAVFFKIMCFAGIFYPLHSFNLNVLKVYGRSDWFLKAEFINKIIAVGLIAISLFFGIYGLVWSSVAISITTLVINIHYTNKLIDYPIFQQLFDLRFTIVISAIVYVISYLFITMVDLNQIYQVAFTFLIGTLCYVILTYLFKSPTLSIIRQTTQAFRN